MIEKPWKSISEIEQDFRSFVVQGIPEEGFFVEDIDIELPDQLKDFYCCVSDYIFSLRITLEDIISSSRFVRFSSLYTFEDKKVSRLAKILPRYFVGNGSMQNPKDKSMSIEFLFDPLSPDFPKVIEIDNAFFGGIYSYTYSYSAKEIAILRLELLQKYFKVKFDYYGTAL